MRGRYSARLMKNFVELWGINPNEIWKEFDIIAGASIGGIQAMGYAMGMSPDDLLPFFSEDGPWIFTTDPLNPSVMPSDLSKVNTIIGGPLSNPTFYPSDVPDIGTMRLKDKLTEVFGDTTLADLNTNVVITSFEKDDSNPDFAQFTNTPIYLSNVSNTIVPGLIGQNALAVDVAMATSAAPLYFAPYTFTLPDAEDPKTYIDGGVTQNNPASFALAVAKAIKPAANRFCILSVGSGLGDVGFPPEEYKRQLLQFRENPELFAYNWKMPSWEMERLKQLDLLGALEGAYLIMYLLGASIAGPQEIVAKQINIEANYTLSNQFECRMQAYLQQDLDTELDNSTPEILDYYDDAADEYTAENVESILSFIAHMDAST